MNCSIQRNCHTKLGNDTLNHLHTQLSVYTDTTKCLCNKSRRCSHEVFSFVLPV